MFPLKKIVLVMVCITAIISGTATAEECAQPEQPPATEQPTSQPQSAPHSASPAGNKKAKTDAEPLFPPAKALRKFAAKVKEAL